MRGGTALAAALLLGAASALLAQEAQDPTRAEESGDKPQFEERITVTATPVVAASEVDRHAQMVTTVSDRQVEDLAAQDLATALRRVPGVTISRFDPIGAYGGADGGAIFIRGHGSGRPGAEIATLVDGIPRFVGIWGHPLLDTLSLDPLEEIVVYRSPQPVLLGNMAFAAVDLVSRRATEVGTSGRVGGAYGSFATVVGEAEVGGRSGALDWRVGASHRASDGHRPAADGVVDAASGRLGWDLGSGFDLALQVQANDGWADDPGPAGRPPLPVVERYATSSVFALATLTHRGARDEGSLKLYLDDGAIDWRQWSATAGEPFQSLTDTLNYGARLRESVRAWPGGELIAGLDRDRWGGDTVERHPGGDRGASTVTLTSTSPYLMLSHTFGEGVTVTPSAGLRYTWSDPFGGEPGYQAGVRVGLGATDLYANAAHAFNLPGAWAAVLYSGFGRGEEWQELRPETLDHLEAGVVHRFGPGLSVQASLFHDRVEDALRFVPPPPPPPLFANSGSYRVTGVELGVEAALSPGSALFVGGTWSDPEPEAVPNLPRGTAVVGFNQSFAGGWRLGLDAEWTDSRFVDDPRFPSPAREVDAFLLVNARCGVPLELLVSGLGGELFVAGENLGDAAYEYRPGYPMPGRSVLAGLEVRF